MQPARLPSPVPPMPIVPTRSLVVEDPSSRLLVSRIAQVAPSDASVLITGETGTGKELVARYIHARSSRASGPFHAINCGALSAALVESELFGHERGSFTGALVSRPGWFEVASGGTLFLDEIGDLPLAAQVTLLRVLQEREVVRVGSRRPIAVDVRLIAATKIQLEQAVVEGRFREDLFYRLHVAPISLLPLRERSGDILPLAQHFLSNYAQLLGLRHAALSPGAAARLQSHAWPGNVRELENAIHNALLVCRNEVIDAADLPFANAARPSKGARSPNHVEATERGQSSLAASLIELFDAEPDNLYDRIEETIFRTAYEASEGNQARTARVLGVSRNVVRARLLHFGIIEGVLRIHRRAPPRPRQSSGALHENRPSMHRADLSAG
jgi:sigma-54-specific transcriptional regulator